VQTHNRANTCHSWGGAVRHDTNPSLMLTLQLPSLSRRVASNDELITRSLHPRIFRRNQIRTAHA